MFQDLADLTVVTVECWNIRQISLRFLHMMPHLLAQVRESKSQGFFVENLLVVECGSVADLMEVFKEGTRNRKVGPHAMNRLCAPPLVLRHRILRLCVLASLGFHGCSVPLLVS